MSARFEGYPEDIGDETRAATTNRLNPEVEEWKRGFLESSENFHWGHYRRVFKSPLYSRFEKI